MALIDETAQRSVEIFGEVLRLQEAVLSDPGNRERYSVGTGSQRFLKMQDELEQLARRSHALRTEFGQS